MTSRDELLVTPDSGHAMRFLLKFAYVVNILSELLNMGLGSLLPIAKYAYLFD